MIPELRTDVRTGARGRTSPAGELGAGLFDPARRKEAARSLATPSASAREHSPPFPTRDVALPRRSEELGESRAAEPEPAPAARDSRPVSDTRARRDARPDEVTALPATRRRLGVPARRSTREGSRRSPSVEGLGHGRRAVSVDDAGVRPAALHERRHALRGRCRPHVPAENPTGIYRRSFTVPRGWRGRRIVLGFGGAEGALYVLVNGQPVGISKDSRTPAEFDVTDLIRHDGPNEIVAVIVRWSDASYIEDQDQWWHAGISRQVYLYATGATHIADVFARGDLEDDYRSGNLSVTASVGGPVVERRAGGAPARSQREGGRQGLVPGDARAHSESHHAGGRRRSRTCTRSSSPSTAARASPAASASVASRCARAGCSSTGPPC